MKPKFFILNSHSTFQILDSRFLLFALLILFLLAPQEVSFAAERALEVVYPSIPGIPTPTTVQTGLPEYVQYIFRFAIIIIGFIIFGVLIYNGIIYMTSSGNPARLGEARSGILAAILGTAVLLGAYLVFNTVNPQLVRLEIERAPLTRDPATPGIYVCEDRGRAESQDRISNVLNNYLGAPDIETQREKVQELRRIMENRKCKKMNFSSNLGFTVRSDQNTFFSIPSLQIEAGRPVGFSYEYGLILHEKDNFRGKAKLITDPPYERISNLPSFDFKARSFTLFIKSEAPSDSPGAILYSCLNYNEPPFACPEGVDPISNTFPTSNAMFKWNQATLDGLEMTQNVRSIQIEPSGRFLAILFDDDGFTARNTAQVISSNFRSLLNQPIGRCGPSCASVRADETRQLRTCQPCLKSMIVIKGQVVR